MNLHEMRKKYQGEWLLIEFERLPKDLIIKEGTLLAHSKNKEDIYQTLLRLKRKNVAIEFAGKKEKLAVMFASW